MHSTNTTPTHCKVVVYPAIGSVRKDDTIHKAEARHLQPKQSKRVISLSEISSISVLNRTRMDYTGVVILELIDSDIGLSIAVDIVCLKVV